MGKIYITDMAHFMGIPAGPEYASPEKSEDSLAQSFLLLQFLPLVSY